MAIIISQDSSQENKFNSESTDINKKFIGSIDKKDSHSTARVSLHNEIHNKYLNFMKNRRTMADSYFRVTLIAVYNEIFKKNLVWKNISLEVDIQLNIKRILKDYSYIQVYDIIKYYSDETDQPSLIGEDIVSLTAMFYSSLFLFVKNELPS